jgi:transposase
MNSKTARMLLSLRHGAFRVYLQHLCHLWGRELCIVGEEFTTQACPDCGVCWDIGGSEEYRCRDPTCGYTSGPGGRDPKSALCIAIKHLAEARWTLMDATSSLQSPNNCAPHFGSFATTLAS